MTRTRAWDAPRWFTYVVLGVALVLSIFPLYWMFVVASNDTTAINSIPPAVVPGPNLIRTAGQVFDTVPFGKALLNSAIVSSAIAVSSMFFASLAGFAFAKLRFRGRNVLFLIVIATMLVPLQLGIVPLYVLVSQLGWVGRLQAVIVPGAVSAFGVFWMRQYIQRAVPDEILEAGRVDGCSTFRLYRSIVLPAIRPAAAVLGLLVFMTAWNDFLWPLIVLPDPDAFTVQVALQNLRSAYFTDYGLVMNGTVLGTVPLLLVFILVGRQLVAGIMEGAVKA